MRSLTKFLLDLSYKVYRLGNKIEKKVEQWDRSTTSLKDHLAGVDAKPDELRLCRYYPDAVTW